MIVAKTLDWHYFDCLCVLLVAQIEFFCASQLYSLPHVQFMYTIREKDKVQVDFGLCLNGLKGILLLSCVL